MGVDGSGHHSGDAMNTSARRLLPPVTVLVGAFAAVLALTTPVPRNFAFVAGGDRLDILLDSSASAWSLGAIVAVVTAVFATRKQSALTVAAVGVAALSVLLSVPIPAELQLRAIAAGLILGGAAAVTALSRILQYALLFGAIAGVAVSSVLQNVPSRYVDYAGSAFQQAPQTPVLIALVVFAALLAVSSWAKVFEEVSPVQSRGRVLAVGIVIPLVGLVLYWLFERSVNSLGPGGAMQNRWFLGLAVIPLLVGAAFVLPAVTGAILLAALAFLSAPTVGSLTWGTALVFVAMLVLGGVVGHRRPSPMVGFVVLAVVAATGVFTGPPLDTVNIVATLVVLPLGVGVAYASLLPTTAPVAVMSVTTPIVVSVPVVAEFGWTAYSPLVELEPTFSPSTWVWMSTGISVVSVLVAGAALVVLRRRE